MKIIAEFDKMIVWKSSGSGCEDVPEPMPGLDNEFDLANAGCDKIKGLLNDQLNNIKMMLMDISPKSDHTWIHR